MTKYIYIYICKHFIYTTNIRRLKIGEKADRIVTWGPKKLHNDEFHGFSFCRQTNKQTKILSRGPTVRILCPNFHCCSVG